MLLHEFLTKLFEDGRIKVSDELEEFSAADLEEAELVLAIEFSRRQFYSLSNVELNVSMALTCAQFLYRAAQFTLLRQVEAEQVDEYLPLDLGISSVADTLSADLCLVYISDLYAEAHRLAPNDHLTKRLLSFAELYPYCSVGIDLEKPAKLDFILSDRSLALSYVDRIIEKKQQSRVSLVPQLHVLIMEVLGTHQKKLWPSLQYPTTETLEDHAA